MFKILFKSWFKSLLTFLARHCRFSFIILVVVAFAPEFCFADTIDGSGPMDDLLIEIIGILEGSVLTAALIISVVFFGVSIALFPNNRETIERGARIVLGLMIAAKGAGFISGALGLSFII